MLIRSKNEENKERRTLTSLVMELRIWPAVSIRSGTSSVSASPKLRNVSIAGATGSHGGKSDVLGMAMAKGCLEEEKRFSFLEKVKKSESEKKREVRIFL